MNLKSSSSLLLVIEGRGVQEGLMELTVLALDFTGFQPMKRQEPGHSASVSGASVLGRRERNLGLRVLGHGRRVPVLLGRELLPPLCCPTFPSYGCPPTSVALVWKAKQECVCACVCLCMCACVCAHYTCM